MAIDKQKYPNLSTVLADADPLFRKGDFEESASSDSILRNKMLAVNELIPQAIKTLEMLNVDFRILGAGSTYAPDKQKQVADTINALNHSLKGALY